MVKRHFICGNVQQVGCPSARQLLSHSCVFPDPGFSPESWKGVGSGFQRHRRKVSPFSCSAAAGHSDPVVPAILECSDLVWGWTPGVTAVPSQLSKVCTGLLGVLRTRKLNLRRCGTLSHLCSSRDFWEQQAEVSPLGQSRRDVSHLALGLTARIHLRASLLILGCALWVSRGASCLGGVQRHWLAQTTAPSCALSSPDCSSHFCIYGFSDIFMVGFMAFGCCVGGSSWELFSTQPKHFLLPSPSQELGITRHLHPAGNASLSAPLKRGFHALIPFSGACLCKQALLHPAGSPVGQAESSFLGMPA